MTRNRTRSGAMMRFRRLGPDTSGAERLAVLLAGFDASHHQGGEGVGLDDFVSLTMQAQAAAVTNGNKKFAAFGIDGSILYYSDLFTSLAISGWSVTAGVEEAGPLGNHDLTDFFSGGYAGNEGLGLVAASPSDTGILCIGDWVFASSGEDGPILSALSANVAAIQTFIQGGGCLMVFAEFQDDEYDFNQDTEELPNSFAWLRSLFPGLSPCLAYEKNNGLTVTANGASLVPGLADAAVNSGNIWHASFEGDLNGMKVLVSGPGGMPGSGLGIDNVVRNAVVGGLPTF